MAYPRPRFRRRRQADSAPRPLGCFWPVFWLFLLILLLGLLFGGYRKGTKVGAPQVPQGPAVVHAVQVHTYSDVPDVWEA